MRKMGNTKAPSSRSKPRFGVTQMDYNIFNTVMGSFVGAAAVLALVVKLF